VTKKSFLDGLDESLNLYLPEDRAKRLAAVKAHKQQRRQRVRAMWLERCGGDASKIPEAKRQALLAKQQRRADRERALGLKQRAAGKCGVIIATLDTPIEMIAHRAAKDCVLLLILPRQDYPMRALPPYNEPGTPLPQAIQYLKDCRFSYRSGLVIIPGYQVFVAATGHPILRDPGPRHMTDNELIDLK
jgi:hypothetical protein